MSNPPIQYDWYVSPGAHGAGTLADPADLATALAVGTTVYMLDGIYELDSVSMRDDQTLVAYAGARPIITRLDGIPPDVQLADNCVVDGVWFGGVKYAGTATTIQMGDNCQVLRCTFFNYYGAIVEGGHVDNLYQYNRFVGCGTGGYFHDIYISGDSSAHIYDNIHVGGEGYKIHLWHSEAHIDVQGNFVADGFYAFVMHHATDQAINNVFWNHTPPEGSWLTVNISTGTFTHNLFGHRTFGTGKWNHELNDGDGPVVDRLGLVGDIYTDTTTWPGHSIAVGPYNGAGDVWPGAGTNYTHYAVTDLPALLGYTEAQIDAAVTALETSFARTMLQIHADATIEGNFTILDNARQAWAAAP